MKRKTLSTAWVIAAAVAWLSFAYTVAQSSDKAANGTSQVGQAAVQVATPKLSTEAKLNIRTAQVETQNVQLQIDQLQNQYNQLALQKQAAAQKLNDAIRAAFDEAKIKQDDYDLNADLSITAHPPKPSAVPPKGTK